MNHEDDGGSLGGRTEEEDPNGKAISYQVNGNDDQVDERDGDAGVCVLKQGQGGVVQPGAAGIPRHDWMW